MKLRHFVLSIALVVSLLFTLGCELIPELESSEPQEPPATVEDKEANPINPDWEVSSSGNQSVALPSIADVVARVKPSVVAITVEVVGVDIFNRQYTQEGGGSGWIIDESGIIVTNAHVVNGATNITVTLNDERVIPVDITTVSTDLQTDLAVLKIDAEGLPALPVGDSGRLRVGDWVVAIGNSLGLGVRATLGIVSQSKVAINEELGQPLRLIETDAAINPGNSGGPLVNMAGEVIGINSAKIQAVEVEGVGWAIASTDALPIIQSLISIGYVVRPWLGVGTQTVNPTIAFWQRLSADTGVLITHVAADSPADQAGLEEGDVVVRFNGVDVLTQFEMVNGIHRAAVGDTIEIIYWRGDQKHNTEATLVESPPPEG
ncbi:MAG: trypsin-like peptidase domain-containing protein [Dehalococcoidales bacterium]|nr:trypsin-like peptidase domain-containing protein [Dehalococcoidales bacterium]